ncbi:ATP-binding protein [Rhodoferax sp.]|uniref:hybrid sensor histidine kinase/response regulator n=1 Tax=Rhodoferax sp. TaxID=50421 RepID=UPI00374DCD14
MLRDQDIQRVFAAVCGNFLVLRPDAEFTIVCASAEYLRSTHTDASIYGRGIFDAFSHSPAWQGTDGAPKLRASLQRVLATGQPDVMDVLRSDVALPGLNPGHFEERYWNPVNRPVLAEDGRVEYVVHHIEETSTRRNLDGVKTEGASVFSGDIADQKIVAERIAFAAESEQQRRIYETALNSTPDFVYVFDLEHRALYANDALLKTWGTADVRGKKWMDLGYEQWHADLHDRELDQVIATRAPIRGEIPFTGTGGMRIYDYIFAPVLDAQGKVVAVAGTTRDVTERHASEKAVRDQAERLAQADLAKDEFLATLSHELRNPLVPLRNGIELLRRYGNTDEKSARVFAMMERQITHLVRLVEDLLEMSRISRGTLSLQKQRVELAAIVRNAVETSEPLVSTAGHQLTVECSPEPIWLFGDPVRLTQILANLLNNAAKFTDNGGRIQLHAGCVGGQAWVSVTDNGIGIDPVLQPRLFEMFSRGNRESTRNQAGLGIGLALARKLALLHDGEVEMYSAGMGYGSRFTFSMPMAAEAPFQHGKGNASVQDLKMLRVLLIEDNREVADSLALVLSALGAEVKVAYSGPDGLGIYPVWRPEVVLLDIGMPLMNGYEVAAAIRARFPEQKATLVALTGWGRNEDRIRARDAGFDHHIVKPAGVEDLAHLLHSLSR